MVRNPPARQDTQVWSLGWEYPLLKEMAYPLQYSCLENSINRGAWWATVHGVKRVGRNWATNIATTTHIHKSGLYGFWYLLVFSLTTRPFRYGLSQIPYEYTVEVRNRFKGLDLIDREPDELWAEVRDIVQENRDQDHPQGKEMQKGKMVVWGGLTNSCEKKRSKKQRRTGKIFPFECSSKE